MRVEIPMLPPKQCSPNWRGHWANRARSVSSFRNAAFVCCIADLDRDFTQLEKAEVQVTLVIRDQRYIRDTDNMLASLKPAIDGCVDFGIIAGDDDAHLRYRLPILYKMDKQHSPLTILEFKEIKW